VETWYLGESIKGETFLCQKLASYLDQIQDPELRALTGDFQRTCERHIDLLSRHVT
jgi:hypothetical protein